MLRCYDGKQYNPVTHACDTTGAAMPGTLQHLSVLGPKIGQLTAVGNAVAATYFRQFDSFYQTKSSTQYTGSNRYDFAYGYNLAGGLTSETYPSGRAMSYTYDAAGRIGSASGTKDSATTLYASQFSYAPYGAVTSLKLGNNIVESTTFNSRLQPQTIAAGGLMTLTFGYGTTDNNGNVVQQQISRPGVLSATQYYRYDGVNRLAIAAENAQPSALDGCPGGVVWCRDYTYDAFGNRAIIDAPGAPASQFAPTALTQFSALTNRIATVPGAANPAYDAVGNLVSHAGVGVNLLYDANNKMTSFTGTSPTLQQQGAYAYDGDGRRVQRQSTIAGTSITTTYVYDAFGNLAAEYSTQATETPDTYYRTTDHLGSTRLVTRANGTVKKCLDFVPFGEPLDDSIANRNQSCYGDPDEGPFKQKFTAKERDAESELDYFIARYYSGILGRFNSVDPENTGAAPAAPQSWNGYAYVLDNPLLFVDPTGKRTEICTRPANPLG